MIIKDWEEFGKYFDENGCINIRKIKSKGLIVNIKITSEDMQFIESVQKLFGCGAIIKDKRRKSLYTLEVTDKKKVQQTLLRVCPKLILRRKSVMYIIKNFSWSNNNKNLDYNRGESTQLYKEWRTSAWHEKRMRKINDRTKLLQGGENGIHV